MLSGCGIVGVGPARAEGDGTHSDLGNRGVGIGCAVLVLRVPDSRGVTVLEADHVVLPVFGLS